MIAIVNYGMGNVGSIKNMLKKVGYDSEIVNDIGKITQASKIILPGVGAFDNAMERIESLGFRSALDYAALKVKVPVLGICLGMQLLTRSSEEGRLSGLGWIEGDTKKFRLEDIRGRDADLQVAGKLRVPHMGWNSVRTVRENELLPFDNEERRFYFVHSYRVICDRDEDVIGVTDYGVLFHSSINHGNIFGTQFHPEKSHKFGMGLLKRFAALPTSTSS